MSSARGSVDIVVTDNIDYDVIKQYIKEQTSPGKDKILLAPGRQHESPQEFEESLFAIFADQHQRIDLLVRSKAGEIRRRLGESFCVPEASGSGEVAGQWRLTMMSD